MDNDLLFLEAYLREWKRYIRAARQTSNTFAFAQRRWAQCKSEDQSEVPEIYELFLRHWKSRFYGDLVAPGSNSFMSAFERLSSKAETPSSDTAFSDQVIQEFTGSLEALQIHAVPGAHASSPAVQQ